VDVDCPDGAWAGAVLLHPHPDYGGTRFDHVVDALYRGLPPAGIAAARFDFRSSDIDAARDDCTRVADELAVDPIVVVGYSFGAAVACTCTDARFAGWALVAPPFGALVDGATAPIGADSRPKLAVVAAHDQFCPPDRATAAMTGWTNTNSTVLDGADHFLGGRTAPAVAAVCDFVRTLAGR
jgi:alpha/beta superfamily hydrolase